MIEFSDVRGLAEKDDCGMASLHSNMPAAVMPWRSVVGKQLALQSPTLQSRAEPDTPG